jgi:DNA-binding response OmpR family regulator
MSLATRPARQRHRGARATLTDESVKAGAKDSARPGVSDIGANAFLCAPDSAGALGNILRRLIETSKLENQSRSNSALICGRLRLHPDTCRAYWDGVDLSLTLGEYGVLYLLILNVGHYVTYRTIYDRLRHEGFITGREGKSYRVNVRAAVLRVRNKFRAADPKFDEIKSYAGFGYCWKVSPRASGETP